MAYSRAPDDDRFLIGGHWVEPAAPASRYKVVSPASGSVSADVADPWL
jgi:hypothetical protein